MKLVYSLSTLIILLVLFGCKEREARERALVEWRRNEAAVERSLHGPSVVEDFEQATMFFWKLTGISIRSELTPLGFFPNRYTAQDLERVKKWCRRNCDRIYWDEKSQSVRVRPK
jgi:hypothetical protein